MTRRPRIGRRAVSGLTPHDLEELQADIAARKVTAPARKAGKAGRNASGRARVAPRVVAMLSAMFSHAVRKGVLASNPAIGARKQPLGAVLAG